MRNLASIQKITKLEPIDGADLIDKANVLGWECVVKKGEFNVGDLCVYFEVDSLLPEKPEFEFMRPKGFRVKTIKLRGQVAQGLCLPMSILPPGDYTEDQDVTELLGVEKYEKYVQISGSDNPRGNFPGFLPKTDETRVQILQDLLDELQGIPFYVMEKLDGQSITVYHNNGEVGVCSRNLNLKEESERYQFIAKNTMLLPQLKDLGNYAVQGELIGPGIQGNKYDLRQPTFRAFQIFNIDTQQYESFQSFVQLCSLVLYVNTVPILATGYQMHNSIHDLVSYSQGKSDLCVKTEREGLVFRPMMEMQHRNNKIHNHRVSFKVINPKFQLKYDE